MQLTHCVECPHLGRWGPREAGKRSTASGSPPLGPHPVLIHYHPSTTTRTPFTRRVRSPPTQRQVFFFSPLAFLLCCKNHKNNKGDRHKRILYNIHKNPRGVCCPRCRRSHRPADSRALEPRAPVARCPRNSLLGKRHTWLEKPAITRGCTYTVRFRDRCCPLTCEICTAPCAIIDAKREKQTCAINI